MRQPIKTTLFALMAILLAIGCSGQKESSSQLPTVAVSIAPQSYFAQHLLDSIAEVYVVVPPGANPETFDLTAQNLKTLSSTSAYFYMGSLAMEDMLLNGIDTEKTTCVNLSSFVPQEMMRAYGVDHTHHHHGKGESCGGDPHYWSSIVGGRSIAEGMYETLLKVFPEHRELLMERYHQLVEEINQLEATIRELLANSSTSSFVIYHPSLSFFAGEWGLHQIAIENEGKEPTPKDLQAIVEEAKGEGVKVVFLQPEFSSGTTETVAKAIGAKTVRLDPLSADWPDELERTAKAIADQ